MRIIFNSKPQGWTTAFVTGVYDYNIFSPTILECLSYWIASALHIRGTWRIPEVSEPIQDLIRPIKIPKPGDEDIPDPLTSESNWPGKHSEIASSAGVSRSMSDVVSDNFTGVNLSVPPYRLRKSYYNISSWMRSVNNDTLSVVTEQEHERPQRPEPVSRYNEIEGTEQGVWLA
ncbi:hypothetical protein AX17_003398 [Amanita inopinata Kibby_2008]|nr:hypothetical protein AX17_003398 [Amanita inopinata Kibby_2008]